MGWPQFTYLVLVLLSLGIELERHGKPKTGRHSFPTHLVGVAIGITLLWFGGFFEGVQ